MRATVGLAVLAFALQQGPPTPPPVFRAGTRLVQVNVFVHDKRGQGVADLKKEDFTLRERGKPQQISFFTLDSATAKPGATAPLPSHTFTNEAAAHDGVPTGVTAVLIDLLNSSVGDQMRARDGVLKFLKNIEPQDRIALFVLTQHGLALLHDYTSDSTALVERMQHAKPQPSTGLEASIASAGMQQDLRAMGLDAIADADQLAADFDTQGRTRETLAAFRAITNHLAGLPGRKNLVWLTSGFPLSTTFEAMSGAQSSPNSMPTTGARDMRDVIRWLNDAGVAMYPVDARGVFNPAASDSSLRTQPQRWNEMPDIAGQNMNTATMFVLASGTGGRVGYSKNDIGTAISQALDDGRVTYTLGYYPAEPGDDGKWRDIKVTVNRPGVEVRARGGYFAIGPVQETPDARAKEIRGAVWGPLDATAIPVTVRADFLDDPPNTFQTDVRVDPASVSFRHEGDRWKAELDMAFVQKDAHGALQGEGGLDTLSIALTDENYKKVTASGLVHRYHGLRQPSAVTLRIVVRDAATGAVGSVTVPFARIRQ